ncbi:ABC transporter permease [Anaerorhabdus sp.]|uniref:ABC transporter permease n=1 Tax=Anaerorhabdus sp. TaxID=1872524 RepID=UPI002FCC0FE1
MNYLRRAWLYVKRKLSKSILLGLTFFVIGNLVLIGLGITQAANNAKLLTRKSMKAIVNLKTDYEEFSEYVSHLESQEEIEEANNNSPNVTPKHVELMSQDERVKAMNYLNVIQVYTVDFNSMPMGNEDINPPQVEVTSEGKKFEYKLANFSLVGNLSPNMIEFNDGTCTLIEGNFYTQDDIDNANHVAVISKDVADFNGLSIGDSITLRIGTEQYLSELESKGYAREDLDQVYEIIGFYTTIEEVDKNDPRFQVVGGNESPLNRAYVPISTVIEENYKMYEIDYVANILPRFPDSIKVDIDVMYETSKAIFLLNDPLDVEGFMEDYQSLNTQFIYLDANNEQFNLFSKPLNNLTYFAEVILIIISITSIFIITLITALTLKSREFEVGVLLSLGVSRIKIVAQFFIELLIILLVSFTCAVGTGSLIANKVGDQVLENQMSMNQVDEINTDFVPNWLGFKDYFTELTQEDVISKYEVRINTLLILEIYIFGIGVVFISILVPTYMIMKLSPKRIMLS